MQNSTRGVLNTYMLYIHFWVKHCFVLSIESQNTTNPKHVDKMNYFKTIVFITTSWSKITNYNNYRKK